MRRNTRSVSKSSRQRKGKQLSRTRRQRHRHVKHAKSKKRVGGDEHTKYYEDLHRIYTQMVVFLDKYKGDGIKPLLTLLTLQTDDALTKFRAKDFSSNSEGTQTAMTKIIDKDGFQDLLDLSTETIEGEKATPTFTALFEELNENQIDAIDDADEFITAFKTYIEQNKFGPISRIISALETENEYRRKQIRSKVTVELERKKLHAQLPGEVAGLNDPVEENKNAETGHPVLSTGAHGNEQLRQAVLKNIKTETQNNATPIHQPTSHGVQGRGVAGADV